MMKRHRKAIIIIGALMLLAGLVLMAEPYYTWALDQNGESCRVALDPDDTLFVLENMNPGDSSTKTITVKKTGSSSANLYMTWDWLEGSLPLKGQAGSLFEQLELTITLDGAELYKGKMSASPPSGQPSAISDALLIGFMNYGDIFDLEFTVSLPGPETGNIFQGSRLITEIVFYTICSQEKDNTPAIRIEKATNGVDADVPNGPFIPVGGTVTWTYVVTNPGRVSLSNVNVTDNRSGVNPVYVSGDNNGDGLLQVGEIWLYRATGVATAGQYANIGTVVGTSPTGVTVTDNDPSHYYGFTADQPVINIEKATNGFDADLPAGPSITVGGIVTWTYLVTNPGTVPLYNIVVSDNRTGVNPTYISGDQNGDGILQVGEAWLFQATGIAVAGQYANIGTVIGNTATGITVTDSDPSHYFGVSSVIPPPQEIEVDPAPPESSPGEEEEEIEVIVPPEGPRTQPPLPRADGVSLGLLFAGLLFWIAGASLKQGRNKMSA